jgi:hypothetical protein
MNKVPFNEMPPADCVGISNLYRPGCNQISRGEVFKELRRILEHLGCVNDFIQAGDITEYIRKKALLTLEFQNETTQECDAYLLKDSQSIIFYPYYMEDLFRIADWYRISGILYDEEELINFEKKSQKIMNDLFPQESDSLPSYSRVETSPIEKVL